MTLQLAIERFWSKVMKSEGCWEWGYAKDKDGHETSAGMSREEAIEMILSHTDRSCNCTLIGPDGQVYSMKER